MNQIQILSSDYSVVNKTGATVKCFEAVTDNFDCKPFKPEETEKGHKRFFADASRCKKPAATASKKELRPASSVPAERNRPPELSHTLLFYLDQIVYLEEISENLNKLDAAIESGNAAKVSLIASDCADISANCGMFAALKPLREIERIENKNQLPKALNLSKLVCEEFERFKVILKENLEQIK